MWHVLVLWCCTCQGAHHSNEASSLNRSLPCRAAYVEGNLTGGSAVEHFDFFPLSLCLFSLLLSWQTQGHCVQALCPSWRGTHFLKLGPWVYFFPFFLISASSLWLCLFFLPCPLRCQHLLLPTSLLHRGSPGAFFDPGFLHIPSFLQPHMVKYKEIGDLCSLSLASVLYCTFPLVEEPGSHHAEPGCCLLVETLPAVWPPAPIICFKHCGRIVILMAATSHCSDPGLGTVLIPNSSLLWKRTLT